MPPPMRRPLPLAVVLHRGRVEQGRLAHRRRPHDAPPPVGGRRRVGRLVQLVERAPAPRGARHAELKSLRRRGLVEADYPAAKSSSTSNSWIQAVFRTGTNRNLPGSLGHHAPLRNQGRNSEYLARPCPRYTALRSLRRPSGGPRQRSRLIRHFPAAGSLPNLSPNNEAIPCPP